MELYLASSSNTRARLLRQLGVRFRVRKVGFNENTAPTKAFARKAIANASGKAVAAGGGLTGGIIIGADTFAVCRGKILGKPGDLARAKSALRFLSGKVHVIYTGLCVYDTGKNRAVTGYAKTKVRMRTLSAGDIDWYLTTVKPFDKAPGYTIEDRGVFIISAIDGSYDNVLGLPVIKLEELMHRCGYRLRDFIYKKMRRKRQ